MRHMAKIIDCLAHNLPLMRKEKKLSQEGLAELVGVSRGTIAKYETGVGGATLDTIAKLASALGCQETDLTNDPKFLNKAVFFSDTNIAVGGVNLKNKDVPLLRMALDAFVDTMLNRQGRHPFPGQNVTEKPANADTMTQPQELLSKLVETIKNSEPAKSSAAPFIRPVLGHREALLAGCTEALATMDDAHLKKAALSLENLTGHTIPALHTDQAQKPRDK